MTPEEFYKSDDRLFLKDYFEFAEAYAEHENKALQTDLKIAQRDVVDLTNKAEKYWDKKIALQEKVEVLKELFDDARPRWKEFEPQFDEWIEKKEQALKH